MLNTLFQTAVTLAATRDIYQTALFGGGLVLDELINKGKQYIPWLSQNLKTYHISNALITYKAVSDAMNLFSRDEKNSPIPCVAAGVSILGTQFLNFDPVGDLKKVSEKTFESISLMSEAIPEAKKKIIGVTAISVLGQVATSELLRLFVDGFYNERNTILDNTQKDKTAYMELMKYGLPKMLGAKLIDSVWSSYISPKLSLGIAAEVKRKLLPAIFDNVAARAIINDPELQQDLQDAMEIEYNIGNNINQASSNIKNLYFFCKDFGDIESKVPINLPLLVINGFSNGLYKLIDNCTEKFNDKKEELEAKLKNSLKDIAENMRTIKAKGSGPDMEKFLTKLLQEKDDYENKSYLLDLGSKAFWNIFNMSNPIILSSVLYNMILNENKEWEDLYPIFNKSDSIYNFSGMLNESGRANKDLKAITRVTDLIKYLESLKGHNKDYTYSNYSLTKDIVINWLEIKYGDTTILNMSKKTVLTPKIYAFVGPSGKGKSTVMEVLRLGKDSISDVRGDVSVPEKFVMFSQNDFIARGNLSLLELLAHPVKITEDNESQIRAKVTTFLTSLKVDGEISSTIDKLIARFDESRFDWREVLSGGEKKLTQLCNFFIQSEGANAIFLDESLNGLDPKLTLNVMKKIKSDWSDKIVIIITHQKEGQNQMYKNEFESNFFDQTIEFRGEELVIH